MRFGAEDAAVEASESAAASSPTITWGILPTIPMTNGRCASAAPDNKKARASENPLPTGGLGKFITCCAASVGPASAGTSKGLEHSRKGPKVPAHTKMTRTIGFFLGGEVFK